MAKTIPSEFEEILRQTILPDLDKGRKNFDRPHTEAVVYWMKYILDNTENNLDPLVMIPAAYAHDWGYIGLFDGFNSDDPEVIKVRKPLHMDRGSEKIRELLATQCTQFVNTSQIDQIAHLVKVHDKISELKTIEEISLMEADTLGMVDISRIKPTFSKEANENLVNNEIKKNRLPLFVHPEIQKHGFALAQKRLDYYQ